MNIKELILQTYKTAKKINALKKEYDEDRLKIQTFFDDKNLKELEIEAKDGLHKVKIIARKVETIKLEYDVAKLKKKLDKEILNEILIKKHTVTNMNGLVKLMKKAGISADEFKQYIHTETTVDKQKIQELYEVGDIKDRQLKGCYDATLSKYIKIIEKKGDTN